MGKGYPGELPYRWHPLGTHYRSQPAVGQIIAWRHMAWRVIESGPRPEGDWSEEDREYLAGFKPGYVHQHLPWVIVVRPVAITGDDPRDRDRDVHLGCSARSLYGFDVYLNEHYPVCAQCGEPLPCRDEMARQTAEAESKRADRYAIEGVCPDCSEPITQRQKSITFDENIRLPGGPPVTFHARRECYWSAVKYEQDWVAGDPDHRAARLSCPGHVQVHADEAECTQGPVCPGVKVPHRSTSRCQPGDRCLRCRDAVAQRNLAGNWTTW